MRDCDEELIVVSGEKRDPDSYREREENREQRTESGELTYKLQPKTYNQQQTTDK